MATETWAKGSLRVCPLLDVAGAELSECLPVPCRAPSVDLAQLERAEVLGQGAEGAAGVDLG
jgi:hypothetical protein